MLNIYPWSSQDTLVFVYLWGKSDFTDSECPLMHMSIVPDLTWSSTLIQPILINMLPFGLIPWVLICANNNSPWTHQNPSIAQSRTLVCRETIITSRIVFFWLLELPVSNRYFSLSCLSFSLLLHLPKPDMSSSLCACVSGKHMMGFIQLVNFSQLKSITSTFAQIYNAQIHIYIKGWITNFKLKLNMRKQTWTFKGDTLYKIIKKKEKKRTKYRYACFSWHSN